MTDLNKIVDELSTLTVIEAAELSKLLEEKWGVTAAAPVAAAAAAPIILNIVLILVLIFSKSLGCLLYTSDAADEEDSVDLGGRRIIKKKRHKYQDDR